MTFTHVLAGALVGDLAAAESWYATLFVREPDARPMDGLLQEHLPDGSGVQVYRDPSRAGRGSLVLHESDLDAAAARLREASVDREGPEPGGGARVLRLTDPDGNSVVLTGT